MQGRRFLLAAIRDVGSKFGGEVNAYLFDYWFLFIAIDGKTQFCGFYRRETYDTTVTDGGKSVAILNQFIF